MKKLILLLIVTVASTAFLFSCEGKSVNAPEQSADTLSSLSGTWYISHKYFNKAIDGPEEIKEKQELETSDKFTEAEAERWTFKKDGTGLGAGVSLDSKKKYDFRFTWRLSDMSLVMENIKFGNGDASLTHDWTSFESVFWTIEEFTVGKATGKMVLSQEIMCLVDGEYFPWQEIHTYRYTFLKVK
jgi:hypothetical protein